MENLKVQCTECLSIKENKFLLEQNKYSLICPKCNTAINSEHKNKIYPSFGSSEIYCNKCGNKLFYDKTILRDKDNYILCTCGTKNFISKRLYLKFFIETLHNNNTCFKIKIFESSFLEYKEPILESIKEFLSNYSYLTLDFDGEFVYITFSDENMDVMDIHKYIKKFNKFIRGKDSYKYFRQFLEEFTYFTADNFIGRL